MMLPECMAVHPLTPTPPRPPVTHNYNAHSPAIPATNPPPPCHGARHHTGIVIPPSGVLRCAFAPSSWSKLPDSLGPAYGSSS